MNAAQSYLRKTINFGGVPMPRAKAIEAMRLEGHEEHLVQRWIQGADLMESRRRLAKDKEQT